LCRSVRFTVVTATSSPTGQCSHVVGCTRFLAGTLDGVGEPGPPPISGVVLRRGVANVTTQFVAELDRERIGFVNERPDLPRGGTLACMAGWTEMWECEVVPVYRHRGVARWLVRHAVERLRLGGTTRRLAPGAPDTPEPSTAFGPRRPDIEKFWAWFGRYEILRCRRGWRR
jgi:GNAT superfamily N-acetyltransferase